MNSFYTAVIAIVIFAAIVMITIISNNRFFNKSIKKSFIWAMILLCIISFTEWLNIYLNEAPMRLIFIHYAIKFIEFSLTPVLPSLVLLTTDQFRHKGFVKGLIATNVIMQLLSLHFGFIFYMDDNNVYVRGPFYFAFVLIYAIAVILMIVVLLRIGNKYQSENKYTLFIGIVFVAFGIGVQLAFESVRTSWMTVELGLIFAFIYLNDMIFQSDKVTTLLNRWCFERNLDECDYDSAIVLFDIDSFKSINDTYGHAAGDEILQKTAATIRRVFGKDGLCYRIGGDEFSVIFKRKSIVSKTHSVDRIMELIDEFKLEVDRVREFDSRMTHIAVGYCFISRGDNTRAAFETADKSMYVKKEQNKADNAEIV